MAGWKCQAEVYNLFADLVPQGETVEVQLSALVGESHRTRARHVLVPDLRLRGEVHVGTEGGLAGNSSVDWLAEVKTIRCCQTRYNLKQRNSKAVDRRAAMVPKEYTKKARDVDRGVLGAPDGVPGPVQARLEEYGEVKALVFGAFGEASQEVHSLVDQLASSRANGRIGVTDKEWQAEKSLAISTIRQRLGVTVVRAQADLLSQRMQWVGEGAKVALAERKQEARRQREEELEQRAMLAALGSTSGPGRRGELGWGVA